MTVKETITNLLDRMNKNTTKNVERINDILGDLLGYSPKQYLNVLTDELFDEKQCYLAIYSLLSDDRYFPCEKGEFGYNFIQNAIYTGYSEKFVLNVVKAVTEQNKGKDIFNQVDDDGDTVMHTAIYCDDYPGDYLVQLYVLLCANGFDSRIVDNDGRSIIDAMKFEHDRVGKFDQNKIERISTLYSTEKYKLNSEKTINNEVDVVEEALSQMSDDVDNNLKILDECLGNKLSYDYEQYLLALTSNGYNEPQCFRAIYSLLKNGANPNEVNARGENFIQNALYSGYSKSFILLLLETSLDKELENPLNVNHVNEFDFSIVHAAIDSFNYKEDVSEIYSFLCKHGFDSNLTDEDGRSVLDIMDYMRREKNKYTEEQVTEFAKIYVKHVGANTNDTSYTPIVKKKTAPSKPMLEAPRYNLTDAKRKQLEEFGRILNFKNFISSPTIGRDDEVKNLMVTLAQDKKNPIIVGESGVGKTAIAEELAYRISIGEVPSFLKDKIILEVSPNELVAGCQYVGNFEEKIGELMKLCQELDIILFIDEIHTMYGVGSTKDKATDMSAMIKHYIDRSGLKIIGTTTEAEYQEFFAHDALKRRFEKIVVKEPEAEVLETIISKVIDDYCKKSGLSFENETDKEEIVNVILTATENSHRVYNDKVNNPDLSISIIDKAFAFAKFYDSKHITKEHFIDSFSYCDRIYESSQERAIAMLKSKTKKEDSSPKTAKIIEFDFASKSRKK